MATRKPLPRAVCSYPLIVLLLLGIRCGSPFCVPGPAPGPAPLDPRDAMPTVRPAATAPAGYLAVGAIPGSADGVVFMEWAEVRGRITGELFVTRQTPAGMTSIQSPLSGMRTGATVNLTITGFTAVRQTITGSIDPTALIVLIPEQPSGHATPLVLSPATRADYYRAVTTLYQRYSGATPTVRSQPSS